VGICIAAVLFVTNAKIPNWQTFSIVIGAVALLAVLLSVLLANINAFLVTDPTNKNTLVIEKYSTGNYNVRSFLRDRDMITFNFKDEVGDLSRALKGFRLYSDNLVNCLKLVAQGDLSAEVPVCSPDDQIGNQLKELVDNFHQLVASIASAIDQVAAGANLVSNSSATLSQGAMLQASSVQELTASLDQISSQTRLNAQNAEKANALTKNAKLNASEGNKQMQDMLKAMEDINVSSGNIGKIIKVIDDIAFQTNILALNAAVEAARAGQQGKGFAVVAEEVRSLAARSASAAKETTGLIEESIGKVEAGTKIAKNTADALVKIAAHVETAAELVGAIAIASNEQASGIEQINSGLMQISQVVQTTAATSEESAAASEELSGQALQLKETVGTFKLRNTPTSGKTGSTRSISAAADHAGRSTSGRTAPPPRARIELGAGDFGKY
jgi:methyl-accepting chemotaxis protein